MRNAVSAATSRSTPWLSLVAFLAATATAAVFGAQFSPGEWYDALTKAPWNPPNWVFGPVWTLLYLGIAIAGSTSPCCSS